MEDWLSDEFSNFEDSSDEGAELEEWGDGLLDVVEDESSGCEREDFKVITDDELPLKQDKMIKKVQETCDMTYGDAIILLQFSQWDAPWAISRFFEDPKGTRRKAGLISTQRAEKKMQRQQKLQQKQELKQAKKQRKSNEKGKKKKKRKKSTNSSVKEVETKTKQTKPKSNKTKTTRIISCGICWCDVPKKDSSSLGCGHRFCNECWSYYLEQVVQNNAKEMMEATCMNPKCNIRVTNDLFSVVAKPKDYERYQIFLRRALVDNNPKAKWCPAAGCEAAIIANSSNAQMNVDCACGFKFCFGCCEEKHNPISCGLLQKWTRKNRSEGKENSLWLHGNTKPCPKCGVDIEKNGGCMHMTCANCSHNWCWMCRAPWSTHGERTGGYYSCNKYQSSDAKKMDEKAAESKREIDRYRHYYERFYNHDDARKKAIAQRSQVMQKMEIFANETSREPQFLMDALELIIECRNVLKYSFVMGFYLPEEEKSKELFNFIQGNTEGITERLSRGLEAPVEQLNPDKLKHVIRVTAQFLKNLVTSIESPSGDSAGSRWKECLSAIANEDF